MWNFLDKINIFFFFVVEEGRKGESGRASNAEREN